MIKCIKEFSQINYVMDDQQDDKIWYIMPYINLKCSKHLYQVIS